MSKIALVTDSTSYIPPALLQRYNITVAPLVLIWGSEAFEDGVDIQPSEFYARLKTATVMPTTSQVTIPKFSEIYGRLLEQDYQILCMLISEKLSGTINSAVQAKAMLPDGAPVEIFELTVDRHGAWLPGAGGGQSHRRRRQYAGSAQVGRAGPGQHRRGLRCRYPRVPAPRRAHRQRLTLHGHRPQHQADPRAARWQGRSTSSACAPAPSRSTG